MSYARNYVHRQTKKEDKYEGLFSKKQQEDLDGGINDITTEKISSKELERRKREQRLAGTGMNMHDPYGFG